MNSFVRLFRSFAWVLVFSLPGFAQAQAIPANADSHTIIQTLIERESAAGQHHGRYLFLSEERSDRTGGHLWTERMAETAFGRVTFLLKIDGQPLSPEREAAERGRLARDAADPDAFRKREAARSEDEQHARTMVALLPRAFLFAPPRLEGDAIRITYSPNPAFTPGSLEERVLHGMSGSVLIDREAFRTREIDGRLTSDITFGFGLLATVKAGSNFRTVRQHVEGNDWKYTEIHADFIGRALFLKTITRSQDARHWDYLRIPDNLSVADAVRLVEQ